MFESVCTDVNFSENLTLLVKYQAQSLRWCYTKVTVHSGIIKIDGEKIYHVYLSENPKRDQTFVKIVLHDMLNNVNLTNKKIIIESDNCSSQYKSVKHCKTNVFNEITEQKIDTERAQANRYKYYTIPGS